MNSQPSMPSPSAATRPITPADAPARAVVPPAEPAAAPSKAWNFYRLLVVASAGVMFLAVGAFFQYNYATAFTTLVSDPPFLAVWLLGVAGAATLAFYPRPWVYLTAGIVVSIMPLMVLVFFGFYALMDPAGGYPFLGAALAVLTILLALPAGIRGFRAARSTTPAPSLARGWRTGHGTFAIGVTLLVLGSMGASAVAYGNAVGGDSYGVFFKPADVGADSKTLVMKDFAFHEKSLSVTAGKLTAIAIHNEDTETHTFTYEVAGETYNLQVLGGVETTAWVYFASAGTVPFRCIPHSSGYTDDGENMVGTITVA